MNIERYSCSYIKTEDNFVIINDAGKDINSEFLNSTLFSVFCVVKNILQRGRPTQYPTKLSNYLTSIIGNVDIEKEVYLISEKSNVWDKTIKGDDENADYPARIFYDKLLPYALGKDFAFAKNLILPEARFEDIVGEHTAFKGQSVDFYLPQAQLVIEIDGSGHKEVAQINKDKERDRELRKHKIVTFRISTTDIRNYSDNLEYELRRIGRMVSKSDPIKGYKESISSGIDEASEKLETIMRLQLLLLSLLMNQKLELEQDSWYICLEKSDVKELEGLFEIAYQDLQFWIQAIAGLSKVKVVFPDIYFTEDRAQADIILDYSLYQRYDDECIPSGNYIYIRTDYYTGKDHFRVAVAKPIKYELNLEKNKNQRFNLLFLLTNIFGHDEFRPGQEQIIANVLNGRDTVGILPTGSGKSICYQLPALIQPGVTVVVDPIISLMMDQKRTLENYHCISHNDYIASNQNGSEIGSILEDFKDGRYQVLWISPERFQSEAFRDSLSVINDTLNFGLAVIDEVHCLSEWGHDFRISYLALIGTLRRFCPDAVLLGLTATASEFVLRDIRSEFGTQGEPLSRENIIASYSMDRSELEFIRIAVNGDYERHNVIRSIIETEKLRKSKSRAQGLLFCKTIGPADKNKSSCMAMKQLVDSSNYDGEPLLDGCRLFYGKMKDSQKKANQEAFMNGDVPLMICTKAFGMGIDNPNIRYTIHNSLPSSVESFYQEAGRAGRDQHHANCYVIYHVDNRSRKLVNKYANKENLLELLKMQSFLNHCDLGTTVFFYHINHDEEDIETEEIFNTLQSLINMPMLSFDNEKGNSKQKVEKSIYKLSLLGIVKDWTVKYHNLERGNCLVEMVSHEKITFSYALKNFLQYVKQYDPEFDIERKEEYLELYNRECKNVIDVIRMLVRWTNNNIVYSRVYGSKIMMDWCSDEFSDESFRNNLDAYFKIGEETKSLQHIAEYPRDWKEWFKVFFRYDHGKKKSKAGLVSPEVIKENHATLQRFLESYQNNTGLNYLDGMFQILYKEQVEEQELVRMNRSIDVIHQMNNDDQLGIIKSTLEITAAMNNRGTMIALSKLIINRFPEMSRMVYEYLHDEYSLTVELEKGVRRMEAIQWTI